jgi:hypothetical protein
VSRAAEALDLSQPAMSFALARLSKGVRRSTGRPGLTQHAADSARVAARRFIAIRSWLDKKQHTAVAAVCVGDCESDLCLQHDRCGEFVFLPRHVKQVQSVATGLEIKSISTTHDRGCEAAELTGYQFRDIRKRAINEHE